MLKQLLEFRETDRKWHFPVLAGLSVGLPIMAGYYSGNMADGRLAAMAGLVILYVHSLSIVNRMITLMACSFGIMVSFSVGIISSGFNPFVIPAVIGLFAFVVHRSLYYLKLTRPPGNVFFIMIASMAVCMPHNLADAPRRIGVIGIGTMISCTMGLLYSLLTIKDTHTRTEVITVDKSTHVNLIESATFGLVVGISLLVAHLLKLENPYWVPTSCVAVMQGISAKHIWLRSIQRILGTFIGLALTWVILLMQPTLLVMCISMVVLQIVVEWLIVRNYAVTVIFLTMLTIFLVESGNVLTADPTAVVKARFFDILIGSLLGAIGGWIIHHERLQFIANRQIRKAKIAISRRG